MSSESPNRKSITQSGRWIKTLEGYRAYHPNPLPPVIEWTQPLAVALANASTLIGKLAGEGRRLPNQHVLIRPFVRREAVKETNWRLSEESLNRGPRRAQEKLPPLPFRVVGVFS